MRHSRLLLALALVFVAATAKATDVAVDCGSGGSLQSAINALPTIGPHTITVSGTCSENIIIAKRWDLTIQAAEGSTAILTAPSGTIMYIAASRGITLSRLTIQGGDLGLNLDQQSEVMMGDSVIENSAGRGALLFLASVLWMDSCTVRDNAQGGIRLDERSVLLAGNTVIENNGAAGVSVHGSRAGIFGGAIRGNQFGVFAALNSEVHIGFPESQGVQIADHAGGGVVLTIGAVGRFGNVNTYSNNTPYDISCDSSAVISDTPSGATTNCKKPK